MYTATLYATKSDIKKYLGSFKTKHNTAQQIVGENRKKSVLKNKNINSGQIKYSLVSSTPSSGESFNMPPCHKQENKIFLVLFIGQVFTKLIVTQKEIILSCQPNKNLFSSPGAPENNLYFCWS